MSKFKMRKRVLIYVDIDTENDSKVSGAANVNSVGSKERQDIALARALPNFVPDERYVLQLRAVNTVRQPMKPLGETLENQVSIMAHEMGHIISGILEVPGGMKKSPQSKGELSHLEALLFGPTREQRARMWTNELVGWEVAHKMGLPIDAKLEREALETYRVPEPMPEPIDPTIWHSK